MKKTPLLLLVAGFGALLVPSTTPEADPSYVLNFGTVAPEGTPWADQLRRTQNRIQEDSGGEIRVRVFLGGSLGSEVEMVQDVARGERMQGGGFSTGAMGEGSNIPLLLLPELPYLFRSFDEADTILDEVLWEPVSAALAEKGFVLGAWAENGWRNFATKGGPARTPEELAEFKMRSQESSVHLNMYRALGVQAVAKPTSEVLPALNTGIVDGFDNTPLFSLAAGWIGPTTHYTLSRHIYQPASIVYSKVFMDSLSATLQAVVMGDPHQESVDGRIGVRQLEAELLQTIRDMDKVVHDLTPEQRRTFVQMTRPVHRQFLANHPELEDTYTEVRARLRTMRQQ